MTIATKRFQVRIVLGSGIKADLNSSAAYSVPSSNNLQDIETSHLSQLRTHVETYCQIVDHNNNQLGRVYQDFQIQLTDLTVDNLLEQFTLAKHTGLEKPGKLIQIKMTLW